MGQRLLYSVVGETVSEVPLPLAHGVARGPRGTAVHRAAAWPRMILRYKRRHPQIPAFFHEVARVEPFVSAHGHKLRSGIFSSIHSTASRSAVPLA